jgi:Glycoside hydrolase family 44
MLSPRYGRPAVALTLALSAVAVAAPVRGPSAQAATTGPALSVDVTAGRHAISPDIYGMNFADRTTSAQLGLTVDRSGGNATSRFNYLNSTTNTGSDYFYENVPATPASTFISADRAAHLKTVWTLPMTGWVAKRALASHPYDCGFPTERFPSQDATDPYDSHCGNGLHNGAQLGPAVPTDTSTAIGPSFDQTEVAKLVSLYGKASAGGVPIYELDNEPSLWNSTHRDVHPAALTYDELASKTTAYAAAIKTADPSAAILGPGDWGWCAYFYSAADGCNNGPDKAAHGNKDFAPWYLSQLQAYQTAHGVRLLDYFDEHYYPQDGIALTTAGSAAQQAQRLQETRTLWDPTYLDDSWIGKDVGAKVDLIPRMHSWIDSSYPGTKLSISEYNFGGLESLNGALTEADVLGIFGRERVDLATLWGGPTATQPGSFAFRLFRNYDGKGAKFGDTSVSSTSADQGKLSVYGAQRSSDGAVTALVINKTGGDLTSSLALSHFAGTGTAQVWRYSSENLAKIVRHSDVVVGASTSLTFPASSATLLVFPAAPKTATTVVVHPSSMTAAAKVVYAAPVTAVPASSVTLTQRSTGKRVATAVKCRNGAVAVGCAAGPVTSVAVTPSAGWLPGDTYHLVIADPGAVDNAFRATTLVPAASPAVSYAWAVHRSPKSYGGSAVVADVAGSSASFHFTGPSITWYSTRGPAQGVADVYVDGKKRAVVNGYAGAASYRVAHTLVHLGGGRHVLTVKVRGTKGSRRATGTQVTVDAVRVGHGELLTSPALISRWSSKGAARIPGSAAALTFVGTGVSWTAQPATSRVAVYVDGVRRAVHGHAVKGLKAGRHKVRLVVVSGSLHLSTWRVA